MAAELRFAIPGDIESRTGGYIYDKRMMAELRRAGWNVEHLVWPGSFPFPDFDDLAAVAESLDACPDNALVLIDGLALGAMPEIAEIYAERLRLVALVHHPLALETGLSEEAQEQLRHSEYRALATVRAVICNSKITAATLVTDYGVPIEKITIAEPGVDSPIDRTPRPPNEIPHILAVGSITPRKGYEILIEALALIADLPWICTIAGSLDRAPETTAALRKQIAIHRLEDRVILVGEVADPGRFYRQADIFALRSQYEGYGMAFAEAMQYGLPVIGCRAGAIPDLVPPSAGILVGTADIVAFGDALRILVNDKSLRMRLSAGALEAAASLPQWEKSAAKISAALKLL